MLDGPNREFEGAGTAFDVVKKIAAAQGDNLLRLELLP